MSKKKQDDRLAAARQAHGRPVQILESPIPEAHPGHVVLPLAASEDEVVKVQDYEWDEKKYDRVGNAYRERRHMILDWQIEDAKPDTAPYAIMFAIVKATGKLMSEALLLPNSPAPSSDT